MAGSWTQSLKQGFQGSGSVMTKVSLVYTADSSNGSVPDKVVSDCSGFLVAAEHIVGATVATTLFDITVKSEDTVDLMNSKLTNIVTTGGAGTRIIYRPTTSDSNEFACPNVGDITVSIANNSVNSATGTLNLYFI